MKIFFIYTALNVDKFKIFIFEQTIMKKFFKNKNHYNTVVFVCFYFL